MIKYAIKDKNNKYYSFSGFVKYLSDASIYDNETEPAELVKNRPDIFEDGPYEIIKVSKEETFKELSKYPEAHKSRRVLEDKLLNVRNHYDSFVNLLCDTSLNHDINAMAGRIARECEATGMKFKSADAFEYSDKVGKRTYRDANGEWLPDKMLGDNNLAFRARRIAEAFATIADTLALLDRYEEFYAEKMNEK